MYFSKTVVHLGVDLILLIYCIYLLKLLTKIGVEFLTSCGGSALLYTLIGFIYIVGKIWQNIRKYSKRNEVFDGLNRELLANTDAEISAVKVERKSRIFCTAASRPSRNGRCVTVSLAGKRADMDRRVIYGHSQRETPRRTVPVSTR